VPKAATAVKRFPWGRVIVGAGLAAAFVVGVLSWRTPEAKVALSPHMEETVPGEIDLIDLEPFSEGCDPQGYETHLEALLSGNPSAGNVACVAALSDRQTPHEVLDGAPLTDDDGMVAHRYRRNAASALAGIEPAALDALCDRLADPSRDVRGVAALALAGRTDDEGVFCVEDVLAGGPSLARDAVVLPFRHYLARGLIGPEEGWALLLALLQDADPEARIAGLRSASMYTARVSEPAVRPLLDDPDPAVAEAAQRALGSIEAVLRADLLQGNVRPD
jgi:hypothetical protein